MIITTTPEPVPDTTPTVAPPRSESVRVWLTEEEKAKVAADAAAARLSMSAYCRRRVLA